MSNPGGRTSLATYFNEIARRVQLQAELLTPVVVHRGEMGLNDQLWFVELLRKYLPSRIGIETGFVVNFESDKKSVDWANSAADKRKPDYGIGPQSDILLTDVLHNAPLCAELAFKVVPIEMVLGTIEITRSLTLDKLREDIAKIARVRELATPGKKRYAWVDDESARQLRPRGYIVGIKSSVTLDHIRTELDPIHDDLRPNGFLLLDKALYIRKPYTLDFYEVKENQLYQFIAIMRSHVESFPLGRTELRSYLPQATTFHSHELNGKDSTNSISRERPDISALEDLEDEDLQSGP